MAACLYDMSLYQSTWEENFGPCIRQILNQHCKKLETVTDLYK